MLLEYSEVNDATKRNLILGNGFSIGINNNFSYNSLIDIAQDNGFLDPNDQLLFNNFNTVNFETILHNLFITKEVNRILEIPSNLPWEKYEHVKEALIKCVNTVHPQFDELNSIWTTNIIAELQNYGSIFTTNYDLLLYWIMSQNDFENFTDYFWNDNLYFDQFNTEIWNGRISVHYLHGALFLFSDEDLEIRKTRKTEDSSLLENVTNSINLNRIPLFISEGTHLKKLNKIKNNSYLNFVFNQFYNIQIGLTIYGQSLASSDTHILEAINKNNQLNHIAISIYTNGKTEEIINNEIREFRIKLAEFKSRRETTIEFFDYNSSAFAYQHEV